MRRIERVARWNRSTPRRSSSRRTALLIADGVVPNDLAAAVKPSFSAASQNSSTALSVVIVLAPIETFGHGARGFNVDAGTVNLAEFERVTTHADGAVGIQISQPIGRLVVHRGVETFGGTGDSLVTGVVMKLAAIALSVKPGSSAQAIEIDGGVTTHGEGVAPVELHGAIGSLRICGGFAAAGGGFDKI